MTCDPVSRGSRATSSRAARPASNPRENPTATARFNDTAGDGVSRSSSSYPATIARQSVRAQLGAVACAAAMRACTRYGPAPSISADRRHASPARIIARSHRDRSCSSSGTDSPSARRRCSLRLSCNSISASNARASDSCGSNRHSSLPSRIASSHSSSRTAVGPAVAEYPSVNTRYTHASTPGTRSGIRCAGGTRNGMPAWRIFAFARVSRCATVCSGCRKARAISAVRNPHTRRSVRATCAGRASAG